MAGSDALEIVADPAAPGAAAVILRAALEACLNLADSRLSIVVGSTAHLVLSLLIARIWQLPLTAESDLLTFRGISLHGELAGTRRIRNDRPREDAAGSRRTDSEGRREVIA